MSLKEHRKSLGLTVGQLSTLAGVSKDLIIEAESINGGPISRIKAEAIVAALSKEHNKPVSVTDLRDLKVLN